MKKGNVTILASIFVMALVAAGVGAGTMAYFTDVETSKDNKFTVGTLDVWIKDNNEGWFNDAPVHASWTSPEGLAPGQKFTTDVIYLQNVGNIDAMVVYTRFCELSNEALAKKLVLIDIFDYSSSSGLWSIPAPFTYDSANAWLKFWRNDELDKKGYITLWDLVYIANPGGPSTKTGLYFYQDSKPELPAGGTFGTYAIFELMKDTKNDLQGGIVTFRIDLIASQYKDTADIDTYITEPLGILPP
jgi:predicted ribosomally synthesized peptide with SipW-like signal peptide